MSRRNYFDHSQNTVPEIKQYKVALYIRLSREDGDKPESDSIQNQKLMLKRYIQDNEEFQLNDIYIDGDDIIGLNQKSL